jgi:acyl-CoA thioesterase-1
MLSAPLRIPVSYGPARTARNPAAVFLLLAMVLCALPAPAQAMLRVVAIGDSLTAGYGLDQGDGLVPQLNRWLADHGAPEAEVINMGVSGDTTAGGRARLGWALAEGADAVILALGANDLLRGIEPSESRANLDAMLADLAGRSLPVLLVGMEAPQNFGPAYKRDFDAIYPDLATAYGAILDPFMLQGITEDRALFQDDGLHPNADGVARIVERLGPLVLELIRRASP